MPTLLLLFLLSLNGALAAEGQFAYQGFAAANLKLDGLAAVMPNGLLALTDFTPQKKGHAFNPTPLHFLDKAMNSMAVARSFSTSFVFAIVSSYDGLSDHGLAFVVAPTTNLTTATAGQYLGLLNATNGTASDHIIAVELDTIMDPEFRDINSNHVGIDINSLMSRQAKSAGYYDDDGAFQSLKLNSHKPMQVWVDYDGQARQLNVTIAPVQEPKPRNPLISEAMDLSPVLADTMYVGFSSSTGVVKTHHYVLGWSFSFDGPAPTLDFSKLPSLPRVGPKPRSKVLEVVLPLATALLITAVLAAVSFFLWRRRRFAEVREDWEDEFGPHRFAYKDLFRATDGFKDRNLLGVGGFGRVYKGVLPESSLEVAVKRVSHDSRQGVKEFVAEVVSIGRLRHRNLAQLLGYCRRSRELLLVYDYMENGSLDKYLYNKNGSTLPWPQRYRVIKGVASSLLYPGLKGTADRMHRRGLNTHIICPLCDQDDETADHIALGCLLSREVWHNTLQRCNLQHLMPDANAELIEWWPEARRRVPRQHRKGFDSLVFLVVWILWKERNARVFQRSAETLLTICKRIADEVDLWKISDAVGLGVVWS